MTRACSHLPSLSPIRFRATGVVIPEINNTLCIGLLVEGEKVMNVISVEAY